MNLVNSFLKTCVPLVRIGFSSYAQKMSAYNAATSYNYHNAVIGDYPDHELNYPSILVSRGNLSGGDGVSCVSPEVGKLTLSWNDNSGSDNANAGDTALLLVFNPEKASSVYVLQGTARSEGSAEISLPSDYSGNEVHVCLAFANLGNMVSSQSRNYVSNSVYAGSVTLS